MTTDVQTCEPNTPVDDLRVVMTERRIRHVPVVTEGRLAGIISIGDVVKSSLDQLQFERDQLDSYVHQT
jgi:CBS domain-containing protein